eukprot:snap_masked-scaffold_9-processed-gene-5.41-mRNA-1 protein AED:1.00 eAED:1.00 QI:0/0/0/0/1/1/2/0/342
MLKQIIVNCSNLAENNFSEYFVGDLNSEHFNDAAEIIEKICEMSYFKESKDVQLPVKEQVNGSNTEARIVYNPTESELHKTNYRIRVFQPILRNLPKLLITFEKIAQKSKELNRQSKKVLNILTLTLLACLDIKEFYNSEIYLQMEIQRKGILRTTEFFYLDERNFNNVWLQQRFKLLCFKLLARDKSIFLFILKKHKLLGSFVDILEKSQTKENKLSHLSVGLSIQHILFACQSFSQNNTDLNTYLKAHASWKIYLGLVEKERLYKFPDMKEEKQDVTVINYQKQSKETMSSGKKLLEYFGINFDAPSKSSNDTPEHKKPDQGQTGKKKKKKKSKKKGKKK